ncbi:hypothetical protein CL618_00530 [archaeon]|nr:hypothetical protein [archaeon]|tara:strand:+ start:1157 stop:1387 length:231 start_codon:yes stop_codon:yes gene_type:complete
MDLELFYLINGIRNVLLDWLMLLVSYLGEFGVLFIIIGLLSLFLDKKNGKKLVVLFVLGVFFKVFFDRFYYERCVF